MDKSSANNKFPTEAFPYEIQRIITAANRDLRHPIDYIASSLLFAASVAVGNNVRVKVNEGWTEGTLFYVALVGRAGANKSHPLSFALKPLLDADKETYKEYVSKKKDFDATSSLSRKEKSEQGIKEVEKPTLKKLLASESTPEALYETLRNNPKGIGVYADELAGWFKNFNRYHSGSEQEFWLSNWSQKPVIVDRKSVEPLRLDLPFAGVIGTIQTSILHELAKGSRLQSGFVDRILFAIPDNAKKQPWSSSSLDPLIPDRWKLIIERLRKIPSDTGHLPNSVMIKNSGEELDFYLKELPEIELEFEPSAFNILRDWQTKNTGMCNECENEYLINVYSKLDTYIIRLSLLMQLLLWACEGGELKGVTDSAVNRAIRLVEYFRKTAEKVHATLFESSPLDRLPGDKRNLYEQLPESCTTEDALIIGKLLGFPERTVKRFLTNKELFKKIKIGLYERLL